MIDIQRAPATAAWKLSKPATTCHHEFEKRLQKSHLREPVQISASSYVLIPFTSAILRACRESKKNGNFGGQRIEMLQKQLWSWRAVTAVGRFTFQTAATPFKWPLHRIGDHREFSTPRKSYLLWKAVYLCTRLAKCMRCVWQAQNLNATDLW